MNVGDVVSIKFSLLTLGSVDHWDCERRGVTVDVY